MFTCDEVGMQCVELWVIGLAGIADFCKTFILVQDNSNNCFADIPITTMTDDNPLIYFQ
jgi:hypothetical protein